MPEKNIIQQLEEKEKRGFKDTPHYKALVYYLKKYYNIDWNKEKDKYLKS